MHMGYKVGEIRVMQNVKSTVFSKYASQDFLPRDSDLPSGVGSVVRLKRLPQGSASSSLAESHEDMVAFAAFWEVHFCSPLPAVVFPVETPCWFLPRSFFPFLPPEAIPWPYV